MKLDRYGRVIPDLDMSPAAIARRAARVAANEQHRRKRGLVHWRRERANIEEHDPFTPFEPYYSHADDEEIGL